ncbi:hypothetical protein GCM10009712_44260 [Pseudarthrobacter sulfonivorans]
MLKRIARNAPLHGGTDISGRGRGGHEQPGLLFSKDTPCGTQALGDPGNGIGGGIKAQSGA